MNAARHSHGYRDDYTPSQAGVHHTSPHNANVTHTERHKQGESGWGRLTVLFLVAGELEFTTQVGLSPSPVSLAGQGRCQQEKPEEEHLADWGESSLAAGTLQAATPESLSPPPGEGCTGVEAPSLLWQQRIAG